MEKKFINTWNLQDFEILTDDGYKDIVALHETIPYTEYIIKTANRKELHCADNHIVFLSNYTDEIDELENKNENKNENNIERNK